jgi:hypothetical protein
MRDWLNREVGYSERAVQSCATARDRAIQVLEETTTKLLRAVETATTIKTLASEFPCPTPPPVQPTPTP